MHVISTYEFDFAKVSLYLKLIAHCKSLLLYQHIPHAEPTGLLVDTAMKLILPWIPEVSVDERREALFRASKHALMRGVTTVVDVGRYLPEASLQQPWDDFSGSCQNAIYKIRVHCNNCQGIVI